MPSFIVEESLNSAKVFWLDQESLLGEIRKVAREIGQKNDNVLKIVLFGSLAQERAVPGSDADILIILKEDARPFIDRISEWLDRFPLSFPVEVFPYTENELDNPFASHAMRTGVTLFDRSPTKKKPENSMKPRSRLPQRTQQI